MAQCGGGTRPRTARVALDPGDGTAANPDAGTGAPGISLGQRSRSAAVRARLWTVDAAHRGAVDRAQVWRSTGSHCGRSAAGQARAHATEAAAACLPTRPPSHRTLAAQDLSGAGPPRQGGRRRHLLLGRIGISRRRRAWQDLGTAWRNAGGAPSRAAPVDVGRLRGAGARRVLVLYLPGRVER